MTFQGFKLRSRNPKKTNSIPRTDREKGVLEINNAEWRPTDQAPPAGLFAGIDARLVVRNPHRASWNAYTRRWQPPKPTKPFGQVPQIGKPRDEPDREAGVFDRTMQAYGLFHGQSKFGRHVFEVLTQFITNGYGVVLACRALFWLDITNRLKEPALIEGLRIDIHSQSLVCRDNFHHTRQRQLLQ